MANICKKREARQVPKRQIEHQLVSGFKQGDVDREQGLTGMARIKRAKLISTRHERGRMEAKHGRKATVTRQLDSKMVAEHHQLVGVRKDLDRSNAPDVSREPSQWVLHGHVRDADGLPVSKQQVGLYRSENFSDQPLLITHSDGKGYFKIEQQMANESEPLTHVSRVQTVALYLALKDDSREVLYQECKPVHPVAGGVTYRDIQLNEVTRSCSENIPTRLLGNSGTRELHDLNNEKKMCNIDRMRTDHRVYFRTTDQAEKSGYDYCAQCFGKDRSKR